VPLVWIQKNALGHVTLNGGFLHPLGFACHVVHSGASGVQNGGGLFFMLRWALCSFHKMCARTRCAKHVFLHPMGYVGHVMLSGASGVRNGDVLFFMLGSD
jgi:hypothetical protein